MQTMYNFDGSESRRKVYQCRGGHWTRFFQYFAKPGIGPIYKNKWIWYDILSALIHWEPWCSGDQA